MRRERIEDGEDPQPPMCGMKLLSKIRPNSSATAKCSKVQRGQHRLLPHDTYSGDSPSATSSDNSYEGDPVSTQTALLPPSAESHRHKKNWFHNRKEPQHSSRGPLAEKAVPKNSQSFSMDNVADPESPFQQDNSDAVEFDPKDIHKLRMWRMQSLAGNNNNNSNKNKPQQKVSSKSSSKFQTTLDSVREVRSDGIPIISTGPGLESIHSPRSNTKKNKADLAPIPNNNNNNNMNNNNNNVTPDPQQETLKIISTQNQEYRKKLGAAQSSFRKLYKNQLEQASLIEKLQLEKDNFAAETKSLREEMEGIRQQLESFKKTIVQQHIHVDTNHGDHGMNDKVALVPHGDENKLTAATPSDKKDELVVVASNVVQEVTEDASEVGDQVNNYWKKEWELSIQEIDHKENEGGLESTQMKQKSSVENSGERPDPFSAENASHQLDHGLDAGHEEKLKIYNLGDNHQDVYFRQHMQGKYQAQPNHTFQSPTECSSPKDKCRNVPSSEREPDCEGAEVLIEIENMVEVDRVFRQHEAVKERLQAEANLQNEENSAEQGTNGARSRVGNLCIDPSANLQIPSGPRTPNSGRVRFSEQVEMERYSPSSSPENLGLASQKLNLTSDEAVDSSNQGDDRDDTNGDRNLQWQRDEPQQGRERITCVSDNNAKTSLFHMRNGMSESSQVNWSGPHSNIEVDASENTLRNSSRDSVRSSLRLPRSDSEGPDWDSFLTASQRSNRTGVESRQDESLRSFRSDLTIALPDEGSSRTQRSGSRGALYGSDAFDGFTEPPESRFREYAEWHSQPSVGSRTYYRPEQAVRGEVPVYFSSNQSDGLPNGENAGDMTVPHLSKNQPWEQGNEGEAQGNREYTTPGKTFNVEERAHFSLKSKFQGRHGEASKPIDGPSSSNRGRTSGGNNSKHSRSRRHF